MAYWLFATLGGVLGVGPLLEDPLILLPDDPQHARGAIADILETRARLLRPEMLW